MGNPTLTIGRLATAANVNVETVRYYQRRGLIPEPERPAGSVRRYGPDDVKRLQFIRRAQTMGFSLAEVQALQQVVGASSCQQTQLLTERKLTNVRGRISDLRKLEADLEKQLDKCAQAPAGAPCPTLKAFMG
ncbi:MerR family transcriptional regulator [Luteimonas terricola]|uniref:Mercuric resistance operon regulatory protein n=1 Tax=Luteimonas terricola TaxID=645597 RepID=A0ABQ2EC51_9GAMM|nr:MerR family transcriptional regulator [Luteimonas terricola]GGK06213.1 MerR family transcriptional regulator [Luteimonas terricola]